MIFTVTLPVPPTANNLFPTSKSGHRFPSAKYKAWRKVADEAYTAAQKGQTTLYGRIRAKYEYSFADKRKRDLANFEKGITDFLVGKGVIEDDSMIDDLRLVRLPYSDPDEALAFVTLEIT